MVLLATIGASATREFARLAGVPEDSVPSLQTIPSVPEVSIVDEVIWVVGDEPILKSDVEAMRLQSEAENVTWSGNPDYVIPEQLAVQKLFLHQAELDSIEVTEAEIANGVEQQINRWIQIAGSKEKLEEFRKQTIAQMRQQMHDDFRNNELVRQMQQELVKDISITPADVRNYFKDLPEDSLPYIPTEVEVEIITRQPKVTQEEINRIKDELREFTDRVNKGETSFATLAHLYSDDTGSSRQGGELGYTGRAAFVPEFAAVAFNLTDPQKISKIVETEYGFHIIQLIDKRGDKINVRHILRKPKVTSEAIEEARLQLDSIADEIRAGKFTFEDAATFVSDDKKTRSNHGLMAYRDMETRSLTSKFKMEDLPSVEIIRAVEKLQPGEISPAFQTKNDQDKTVCAIIKLKSRTEGHRATITEDFQAMQNVVLAKERDKFLHDWVENKIKHTYVRMKDRYKDGTYEYNGWVK